MWVFILTLCANHVMSDFREGPPVALTGEQSPRALPSVGGDDKMARISVNKGASRKHSKRTRYMLRWNLGSFINLPSRRQIGPINGAIGLRLQELSRAVGTGRCGRHSFLGLPGVGADSPARDFTLRNDLLTDFQHSWPPGEGFVPNSISVVDLSAPGARGLVLALCSAGAAGGLCLTCICILHPQFSSHCYVRSTTAHRRGVWCHCECGLFPLEPLKATWCPRERLMGSGEGKVTKALGDKSQGALSIVNSEGCVGIGDAWRLLLSPDGTLHIVLPAVSATASA